MKKALIILAIALFVILYLIAVVAVSFASAEEDTCASDACPPGTVYRQYRCPDESHAFCDPYVLVAQRDEYFCEIIVYVTGHREPFIRFVPSYRCYRDIDDNKDGWICIEFYADHVSVQTSGITHPIQAVYTNSLRNKQYWLPITIMR